MIILPPPWQGLHPAFPKRPDPFDTNSLTSAPVIGGTFGLAWATGATLFRRSPQTGLKAAAYITVASAIIGLAAEQLTAKIYARPYLESKGITVPRQKLVSRLIHIDEDNFILAGGIAGLLFARSVAKSWQVTGWKRVVGSFSMGAFVGDLGNYAFHWRHVRPCAEKVQQQKDTKALYANELKAFRASHIAAKYGVSISSDSSVRVGRDAADAAGKQIGSTSMQQLLRDLQKTAEENLEKLAATDAQNQDATDPQPHYSEMRDGERVFRPDTNYTWTGTPEDIESHIAVLRQRRESLKQEAELLWHKMAVNEAEYHSSPSGKNEESRISLEILNHLHINAYLEISQLDWMIADSQKTALQLRTLAENKKPWVPSPPANSKDLVPKHTMQLLHELERDNTNGMTELELYKETTRQALQEPALEVVDRLSGMPHPDPYATAKQDLEEVEKNIRELKIMRESIERLKKELGEK
ncbi:hypothetical protein BDV97DRAFT_358404 [Delphinella strobiligena]|nr:hypothetical protein BDV97DRAFT_358404 [Delphinella strobiligena]